MLRRLLSLAQLSRCRRLSLDWALAPLGSGLWRIPQETLQAYSTTAVDHICTSLYTNHRLDLPVTMTSSGRHVPHLASERRNAPSPIPHPQPTFGQLHGPAPARGASYSLVLFRPAIFRCVVGNTVGN